MTTQRPSTSQPPADHGDSVPVAPLKGLRVVEIGQILAAPLAGMILGDLGATVIKVERPGSGDPSRSFGPPFIEDSAYYFHSLNRNKKSVVLDLSQESGRAVLYSLLSAADILIHNHVQPVAESLGIDEPTVRLHAPDISYVQIGAREDGTSRSLDMLAQAEAGAMAITGWEGQPPVKSQVPIADITTGLYAAVGALAALRHKYVTGDAGYLAASLFGSTVASLPFHWGSLIDGGGAHRFGNGHPTIVPYNTYESADARHVAMAVVTERQWDACCTALELDSACQAPHLSTNRGRVAARAVIDKSIAAAIQRMPAREATERLTAAGVPVTLVQTLGEVFDAGASAFRTLDTPGGAAVRVPGSPIVSIPPWPRHDAAAPRLGADSRAVLAELGYPGDEIDSLVRAGAVGASDARPPETDAIKEESGAGHE